MKKLLFTLCMLIAFTLFSTYTFAGVKKEHKKKYNNLSKAIKLKAKLCLYTQYLQNSCGNYYGVINIAYWCDNGITIDWDMTEVLIVDHLVNECPIVIYEA